MELAPMDQWSEPTRVGCGQKYRYLWDGDRGKRRLASSQRHPSVNKRMWEMISKKVFPRFRTKAP